MDFLFNIPFLPFFLILLISIIIFLNFKKQNKKIFIIEALLILLALAFLIVDINRIFFAEGISLIGH